VWCIPDFPLFCIFHSRPAPRGAQRNKTRDAESVSQHQQAADAANAMLSPLSPMSGGNSPSDSPRQSAPGANQSPRSVVQRDARILPASSGGLEYQIKEHDNASLATFAFQVTRRERANSILLPLHLSCRVVTHASNTLLTHIIANHRLNRE